MSDKRERAGNPGRVSDEDIDRAARSLVAANPSTRLSTNVMRRLHNASAALVGFVPAERLHRWQLAFALLATLFVGVVGLMQIYSARPPEPRITSSIITSSINPPATEATPPQVAAPVAPAPTQVPAPRARVAPRRAQESPAPQPPTLTRLVGPRLAERSGRRSSSPSATWDLVVPSQPEQATVDPLPDIAPGIAPLELVPLLVPPPLAIPPILIPELTLTSVNWGRA